MSVVGKSVGIHSLNSAAALLACAEIKIVEPNDPQYDIVAAFPETNNFERWECSQHKQLMGKVHVL